MAMAQADFKLKTFEHFEFVNATRKASIFANQLVIFCHVHYA